MSKEITKGVQVGMIMKCGKGRLFKINSSLQVLEYRYSNESSHTLDR